MARISVYRDISVVGLFARRLLLAAFFVFAAYNPTGRSYYHWVVADPDAITPLQAVAGIALLIALVALIRIAGVALRIRGVIAVIGLFFGIVSLRVGLGLDRFAEMELTIASAQVVICVALAFGMTWAHAQVRFSGERDLLHNPP